MPRGYPRSTPYPHGTHARYCKGCRCPSCTEGHRKYCIIWTAGMERGHLRTVDSTITARKLQALVALGWSYPEIGARLGVKKPRVGHLVRQMHKTVTKTTAAQVDAVYRELCMQTPPARTGQERYAIARAKIAAGRFGWAPPLAWDDIEDIDATPDLGSESTGGGADIDEWLWLVHGGEDPERAARRLGVTIGAIEKQGRRMKRPEVYEPANRARHSAHNAHYRKAAA